VPEVGTLADPSEPNSLAKALLSCLAQTWDKEALATYAAARWAPALIAQQHLALYTLVCQ